MMRVSSKIVISSIFLALLSGNAGAVPVAQLGASVTGNVIASEDFEGYLSASYQGTALTSGGFNFSIPLFSGSLIVWDYSGLGLGGSKSLYQNGGGAMMTSIKLENLSEFNELQFSVGNGYGSPLAPPRVQYVWLRTYLNGSPTGYDFDFNEVAKGSFFTVSGRGFDEVKVQSYDAPFTHNETDVGGIAIDNVVATSGSVPEPATTALLGLGLLGFAASRRKEGKSKNV